MANDIEIDGYLHLQGFDSFQRDAFDKRQIRAAMRKAGKRVAQRAQMNLALGKGQQGYPVSRTGRTLESITFRVSRAGFMVKVAPRKTGAMKEFYPAYLHHGVKQGRRLTRLASGQGKGRSNRRASGERAAALAERAAGQWRIKPHANYMADALQDSSSDIERILSTAFAAALN